MPRTTERTLRIKFRGANFSGIKAACVAPIAERIVQDMTRLRLATYRRHHQIPARKRERSGVVGLHPGLVARSSQKRKAGDAAPFWARFYFTRPVRLAQSLR